MSLDNPQYFERPIVIVGDGTINHAALEFLVSQGFYLVAADGAANRLDTLAMIPDLIVGDLDSLTRRSHWERQSSVLHLIEQETTDFEKCLYSTQAPAYFCVGLDGKRFDHTLAAMHVVTKYSLSRKIVIIGEMDVMIAVNGYFSMKIKAKERVSIYPLQSVHIAESSGFKYPLNGLTLVQGQRVGTSNQTTTGLFEIIPQRGDDNGSYLVIIAEHWLAATVEQFKTGQ